MELYGTEFYRENGLSGRKASCNQYPYNLIQDVYRIDLSLGKDENGVEKYHKLTQEQLDQVEIAINKLSDTAYAIVEQLYKYGKTSFELEKYMRFNPGKSVGHIDKALTSLMINRKGIKQRIPEYFEYVKAKQKEIKEDAKKNKKVTSLSELDLSSGTRVVLYKNMIQNVDELISLVKAGEDWYKGIKGLGKVRAGEVANKLVIYLTKEIE